MSVLSVGPRLAAVATLFLLSSSASAHILVTAPIPRVPGQDNLKSTPCGDGVTWGQGEVHTYAPGETVTVEWNETISHAGYFRVVLGTGGDASLTMPSEADFDAFTALYTGGNGDVPAPIEEPMGSADGDMIVYYDYYAPHPGQQCAGEQGGGSCTYSVDITLPDSCEGCTLQVIQTMAESSRTYGVNAHYYQCIDLAIEGEPAAGNDGMGGMNGMPEQGAGGSTEEGAGGSTAEEGVGGDTGALPEMGMGGMTMEGGEDPAVDPLEPPTQEPEPLPSGEETTPAGPGPAPVTPTGSAPPAPDTMGSAPLPTPEPGVVDPAAQSGVGMPASNDGNASSGGGDDGGCSFTQDKSSATSRAGSAGWLALLGLSVFAWRRRRG